MTADDPDHAAMSDTTSAEEREREAAVRRAEALESEPPEPHDSSSTLDNAVTAVAFTALAENVRDYAIFLMDVNGVITFWGEGARLIKWWTRRQAEGSHLRLLYPSGGAEDGTAEEHLRAASERGEYSGEGRRIRSDGSAFWASTTLTALRSPEGSLLGFAKVTRDMTTHRAAAGLLQAAAIASEEARQAAVSASAAKSGFLAAMSHEIRTPINAIIGYLQLLTLEIDGPLAPVQRSYLTRATAAANHLLGLVGEVLDFSRIQANQAAVERKALRIGDVVSDSITNVAPQARAGGVHIVDATGGLAARLAVWGDEVCIRQIVVNLLANAVKFANSGEHTHGRITISAGSANDASPAATLDSQGPWVYVRVEDTGPGIDEWHLSSIFEPFVQVDMSLTREHGGAGLGLAISRKLARRMGGDVTVRSRPGVGSTFMLWLPAAPVESIQSPESNARMPDEFAIEIAEDEARGVGASPVAALRVMGNVLLAELERILHAYIARVISDPATSSARSCDADDLEDHLASFLADIAATLPSVQVQAIASSDTPNEGMRDGTTIQRVISMRHGQQRARLGWKRHEIQREFVILNEEVNAAIMRRLPDLLTAPTEEARRSEATEALGVIQRFLTVAEGISLESYDEHARE